MSLLKTIIKTEMFGDNEEAFFILNVENILKQHEKWTKHLPRVIPYYAVKCNNLQLILEILSGLGLGFDCSSQSEVEQVHNCGTSNQNIVFANTFKSRAQLRYIKSFGVDLMQFDNEDELGKIADIYSSARLILRIKAQDDLSTSKLTIKCGAETQEFEYLLNKAKSLNLNVVGVGIHAGNFCKTSEPFTNAIRDAKLAFNIGSKLGYKMSMLDIGGGLPGFNAGQLNFKTLCLDINNALDKYFPNNLEPNANQLTIIAEPGRFYSISALDLYTQITSKRVIIDENQKNEKLFMYYINDGLYGSFRKVISDNGCVEPIPVLSDDEKLKSRPNQRSVIWGPTCDGNDFVRKDFNMPQMNVGEWIMFKYMGAYSLVGSTRFNGQPLPKMKVFVSDYAQNVLLKLKNWPKIEKLIRDYDNKNISELIN